LTAESDNRLRGYAPEPWCCVERSGVRTISALAQSRAGNATAIAFYGDASTTTSAELVTGELHGAQTNTLVHLVTLNETAALSLFGSRKESRGAVWVVQPKAELAGIQPLRSTEVEPHV
jgi:hypothetical protein